MNKRTEDAAWLPEGFGPEQVDTVIVAFPDVYGRLMGKRLTRDYFLENAAQSGIHACNYMLTIDVAMNPLPGFKLASWDQGYGDFQVRIDRRTLRRLVWVPGTALVLGHAHHEDGRPVAEAPRQILAAQIDKLARHGQEAAMGSELEFFLFHETYQSAREKGYRNLTAASEYLIDYHTLQPGRDEDVLRRIRNEMTESGIAVECSKGEWGKGQHEINLLHADAMEMADRHVIYKMGVKEIAAQQGRAITFMSKWTTDDSGNGFHLHTSVWDRTTGKNLFHDPAENGYSTVFRQFIGGLLKYCRELSYFFAPTVNSYKRYQHSSWAPTAVVCGHDNRTCGFRVVGSGSSLRVENRMPCADANPYLAFAATLAAGMRGVEEKLDCGPLYEGNAYEDPSLPRLPRSLEEAATLLQDSAMARDAFGQPVVEYLVHTARLEAAAFQAAVTDWERDRYFEQL